MKQLSFSSHILAYAAVALVAACGGSDEGGGGNGGTTGKGGNGNGNTSGGGSGSCGLLRGCLALCPLSASSSSLLLLLLLPGCVVPRYLTPRHATTAALRVTLLLLYAGVHSTRAQGGALMP